MYSLAYASNIANLGINFSNLHIADSRFLTEEEFLSKSLASPLIIGAWLVLFISYYGTLYTTKKKLHTLHYRYVLLALLFPVSLFFLPLDASKPFWQQYNVFEENITAIFETIEEKPYKYFLETNREYARFMQLNLPDNEISKGITKKERQPNILIVTIEGLSEQFLRDGAMPNLQKLAENNIHYTNFIYHQRFTENGLYSILCGDMPTLYRRVLILSTTPGALPSSAIVGRKNSPNKWGNIVYGTKNNCLPKILGKLGYKTAFFQASNIHFSKKNLFMKNVGIQSQYGHKLLRKLYPDIKEGKKGLTYGMPDHTFYPRVQKELHKINAGDKPWFAALMTTSTHFPLFVKDEFKGKFNSSLKDAFHTADHALNEFLTSLEAEGLLNNTLLIVTGDESGAMVKKGDIASMLASNWGALVIKTPDNINYSSKDYFVHSDLMTSILDYIGHVDKAIRGRSVFRKYEGFRPVMFANIRTDRWFTWYERNKLIVCANYFKICQNLKIEGDLFNATLSDDTPNRNAIDLYISVARKNDYLYTTDQSKKKRNLKSVDKPKKPKKRAKKIKRNNYDFFAPAI
ncbi:MAG: LTA synthase family protein [Alphaproteobacteria bacterium]